MVARTGGGAGHCPPSGAGPAGRDPYMDRTAARIAGPVCPLWVSCWPHWSCTVALEHKLGYTLVFGVRAPHLKAHDWVTGRLQSENQPALLRTSRECRPDPCRRTPANVEALAWSSVGSIRFQYTRGRQPRAREGHPRPRLGHKEPLGHLHIARLAQHGLHQVPSRVDSLIKVAPAPGQAHLNDEEVHCKPRMMRSLGGAR